MGADDGGGNKPHPTAKNPQPPCNDAVPGHPRWSGYLDNQPRVVVGIPIRSQRPQQVAEPAGYAVAGKILLAAAGALAGVLLALVAMYLYNTARRRRRLDGIGSAGGGGGRRWLDRSPAIAGGDDGGAIATTPRGLDPAVLRALPVGPAREGAGDCAVCLAEVQPGEKARALPRCGHAFHADCIDAWFRGNATCPLCRADVAVVAAPDDDAEVDVRTLPEVRIDVAAHGVYDDDDSVAAGDDKRVPMTPRRAPPAPAMGRLPSGTDLDKTRRAAFFASTRSVSFS